MAQTEALQKMPENGTSALDAPMTQAQVALIKRTIAKDANDDEFAMFLHYCKINGMDPLLKQCYFQVRVGKKGDRQIIMMPGIDGMRSRAEKMPDYLGITSATVYDGDEFSVDFGSGEVRHIVGFPRKSKKILGAWAKILRKGRDPYIHWLDSADYSPSNIGAQMAGTMFKKSAEAQALRHEYPEKNSNAYAFEEFGMTEDQMEDAPTVVVEGSEDDPLARAAARAQEPDPPQETDTPPPEPATDKQRDLIKRILKSHVWTEDEKSQAAFADSPELGKNVAKEWIDNLTVEVKKRKEAEGGDKVPASDAVYGDRPVDTEKIQEELDKDEDLDAAIDGIPDDELDFSDLEDDDDTPEEGDKSGEQKISQQKAAALTRLAIQFKFNNIVEFVNDTFGKEFLTDLTEAEYESAKLHIKESRED